MMFLLAPYNLSSSYGGGRTPTTMKSNCLISGLASDGVLHITDCLLRPLLINSVVCALQSSRSQGQTSLLALTMNDLHVLVCF